MLDAVFGSKSVQRILIFLFVNGKCYGTQLRRLLGVPLTPLQKALLRLERGGIVISYYEGKTRFYQLNPAFPLLTELEQLLKKGYTLLPPREKKKYYVMKEESENPIEYGRILQAFWERLGGVSRLILKSKQRTGRGEVVVTKEGGTVLIFTEKGTWESKTGQSKTDFSNVFRWTLDRNAGVVLLEHLRHGVNNPVFLFHLAPASSRSLSSVGSHLVDGDAYFGQMFLEKHALRLSLRVIGPEKNEEMEYCYSLS